MRSYVKLYKNGDNLAIATNINDEGAFNAAFSEALADLIDSRKHDGDWQYQLAYWMPQYADIVCKLRGYKAVNVEEQRVLIAGTIPPDDESIVAAFDRNTANGKAPEVVGV